MNFRAAQDEKLRNYIWGQHFGRGEAEVEKGLITDETKQGFRCLGASNGECLHYETVRQEWRMEA